MRPAWQHRRYGNFPEFHDAFLFSYRFQIMRIIIFAVNKQYLFRATTDVKVAVTLEAQVTGIQPSIGCKRLLDAVIGIEITAGHIAAANLDMAH